MRNRDWHEYAIRTIEQIRNFRQSGPLGNYISQAEYIDSLEDYLKLFYGVNAVPQSVENHFKETKESFNVFKRKIEVLCDILLKKVNDDNDTTKDKEAS